MQQDNIKDFAIAAFRYRGHLNDTDTVSYTHLDVYKRQGNSGQARI